jgi:hypothetical protein
MLWYVDCCREQVDLTVLNTLDGDVSHFKLTPKEATFDVISQVLLVNILKNKPHQIIFDKAGVGLGLYDAFVGHIKAVDSVAMTANGELAYVTKG